MKNKIIPFVFAVFTCLQCRPIPGRSDSQSRAAMADGYIKKYGLLLEKKDTVIVSGNLKRIYEDGKLSQIGYLKNGQKSGDWYVFSSSLQCVALVFCQNDTTSSIKQLNNVDW